MNIQLAKWRDLYKDKIRLIFLLSTIIGFVLIGIFVVYGFTAGIFASAEAFASYIESLGFMAPAIFIFVQAIQVIVPVLPGAIGCAAGVIAFGPILGFVYSYLGICLGSFGAFLLAKHYGMPVVEKLVNPKLLKKYKSWLEDGRKFDIMFAIAIFMPVAPDDFLCYLAGLTPMTKKRFAAIILLCKPASIALYSLGLIQIGSLLRMLHF